MANKEMLINVSEGEECRIALLDDGRLEELYMERTSSTSHVGNIYKGKVTNVEPSIQAAFVDFGLGRNGFLHISDLMPTYFGHAGDHMPQETVGRKMARRDRPPIQRCLRRGDEIVVQIIKEGIGTKGPTLSTYLSIPGRILVMMPGMGKMGVSRKIEDDEERRRLRQILDSLKPPKDVGFIIRTAGVGKTKTEIQRDLTYLTRLWQNFEKKRDGGPGPMELYTEGDLVTRTVRDIFANDIDKIVVDNREVAKRVKEVIKLSNPRTKNKVELYDEPVPLFHKYGIEKEIEQIYSRHVPLPSGGSLVIDSTEAIVAIDVNSGKFRDHSDAEMTAFKTDMEAADEIPRQLRLRDLGGVIICDFIDLRYERHRRELEKKLHDAFQKDRAKTKVLRMSQFGIIEMTRQRMRPSLKRSIYFDCPHCKGAGLVKTHESMSLDVMRRLAIAINDLKVTRVELLVHPEVNFYLQNKKRAAIADLEGQYNKRILIKGDGSLGLDQMKLDLYDGRDGLVFLDELGMIAGAPPHVTQLGPKPSQARHDHGRQQQGGGRGGRGGGRDGARPQLPPPRESSRSDADEAEEEDDSYDLDRVEADVEQREEQLEAVGNDLKTPPPSRPRPPKQILEDDDDDLTDEEAEEASEAEAEVSGERLPADINTEAASESVEPDDTDANGGGGAAAGDRNDRGGEGGGRRGRRRRGRRGRGRNGGGGGGGQGGYGGDGGGIQPQEQLVGGGYVDEYDVGEDDGPTPGNERDARSGGNQPRGGGRQPVQARGGDNRGGGRPDNRGGRNDDRNRGGGNRDGGRRNQPQPQGRGQQDRNNGRPNPPGRPPQPKRQPVPAGDERDDHGPGEELDEAGQDQLVGEAGGQDTNDNAQPLAEGEQPPEGGRRRRRRRRGGRRRRGRGGQGNAGGAEGGVPVNGEPALAGADDLAPDNGNTESDADVESDADADVDAPRDREVGAPVADAQDSAVEEVEVAEVVEVEEGPAPVEEAPPRPARRSRSAPRRTPPTASSKSAPKPTPPPEIPRTGSTDKHLVVDDEPVLPQPTSRPGSYRDLDAIPDDYD